MFGCLRKSAAYFSGMYSTTRSEAGAAAEIEGQVLFGVGNSLFLRLEVLIAFIHVNMPDSTVEKFILVCV